LRTIIPWIRVSIVAVGLLVGARLVLGQDKGRPSGSYAPVDIHEAFSAVLARMSAAKSDFLRRQMALLDERYDFRDDHEPDTTTSRGKPIQRGERVTLAQRITWNQLANLAPEQIKNRDIFPAGFLPLPHPNHPEGGMLLPKTEIDELNNQVSRNLTRFDLDCLHDPRSPEVLLRESGARNPI
jgi:cytochrome c peroxidase